MHFYVVAQKHFLAEKETGSTQVYKEDSVVFHAVRGKNKEIDAKLWLAAAVPISDR